MVFQVDVFVFAQWSTSREGQRERTGALSLFSPSQSQKKCSPGVTDAGFRHRWAPTRESRQGPAEQRKPASTVCTVVRFLLAPHFLPKDPGKGREEEKGQDRRGMEAEATV